MPALSGTSTGRPTALPLELMLVNTAHTFCTCPVHPHPYTLGFSCTCFHTRVHYAYTLIPLPM